MGAAAKVTLRAQIKKELKELESPKMESADRLIIDNLRQLIKNQPSVYANILAWIPCFRGEINLGPFIDWALLDHQVYLPHVQDNGGMEFIKIGKDWKNNSINGTVNTSEFKFGEVFDLKLSGPSLMILPGLAFDRLGNRLGRGKGHYDRYLADNARLPILKVAVAYSMQLLELIPVEKHDVRVDYVCTEKEILKTY